MDLEDTLLRLVEEVSAVRIRVEAVDEKFDAGLARIEPRIERIEKAVWGNGEVGGLRAKVDTMHAEAEASRRHLWLFLTVAGIVATLVSGVIAMVVG